MDARLPISRRRLMKMSAGVLLAAGAWPGALAAQNVVTEEFPFICINDLHYIDTGCVPFFSNMIKKMKEASPAAKLLLVVGDTCENGTAVQINPIRDILKSMGLDTKVVIGNHDWTTQTDRKIYEQAWPGSINYTFEYGGWQFMALDSSDGVKYENTAVQKPTLDWVDQTLPKLSKTRPLILFTHFPLGSGVKYQLTNSDDLLNRFKEHNLRGVFNGHFHGLTERTKGDVLITTHRCCSLRRDNHDGTKEKGFFACRTTKDGGIVREFVEVEIPK